MTLATTEARLQSILEGTPGVGKVYPYIRNQHERDTVEADMVDGSNRINLWEFQVDAEGFHDGASGLQRNEGSVTILVHFYADDAGNSRGALRDILEDLALALMVPSTGFPQMKEPGVRLTERPTRPISMRTGHSAYRAQLDFRLWNLENT